ncbi:hypothetical protein BLNAU_19017 [Blattamonas nauphoetae]|uniref:Uncharacterized protein n=1 Tax=Blattamonas nauphoetae TaxID=2049346 RepID=A0ABQ9X2R1_9EUKA|nr:hypothetical protein BLNAU_19017 [Blattamonas nauphoetae]
MCFLPFSDDALSKAYKLLEFLLTQPLNPESTEIWPDSHITPQQWFDGLLAIAHTNSGYLLTIILRLIARISSDLNHESRVVVLTSGHTQFHSLLLTSVNDLLSLALTPEMEQDDNIPAGQTSHHSNIVNHLILPMQPYFRYFSRHHLMFPDLSTNTIFLVAVSKIAEIFVADVNLLSITSLTLHFSTYLSILEACKRELEWYLRLFDFRQFRARWMKCSKQTDNWNEFMRSLNEYGLSDVLDRQGFMDESGRCGGRNDFENNPDNFCLSSFIILFGTLTLLVKLNKQLRLQPLNRIILHRHCLLLVDQPAIAEADQASKTNPFRRMGCSTHLFLDHNSQFERKCNLQMCPSIYKTSHRGSAFKAGAVGQRVVMEADGRKGKRMFSYFQLDLNNEEKEKGQKEKRVVRE